MKILISAAGAAGREPTVRSSQLLNTAPLCAPEDGPRDRRHRSERGAADGAPARCPTGPLGDATDGRLDSQRLLPDLITLPLIPYAVSLWPPSSRLVSATVMTFAALFAVGALRSTVTEESPITGGLEMLGLGVVVAAVAYYSGTVAAWLLA